MPAARLSNTRPTFGGSGEDQGRAIAVDASGSAYVTGNTRSSDFPTTAGGFQTSGAGSNAFVTKLNPSASALAYSTYLGSGSSSDSGRGIAVDADGNAHITGVTAGSRDSSFPTENPLQPDCGRALPPFSEFCSFDAFLTKFNTTGSALLFSTYLGGNFFDVGEGIALDADGNTYLTGRTGSTDFPTTQNAFDSTCGTDGNCFFNDVFVAKILPPSNLLPVADAGAAQTVESSPDGASITLDGSGSSDPDDGDVLTFEWKDADGNVVGTTATVNLTLPLGEHTFTLTVDDGNGGTDTDMVDVAVVDTTPPTLSVTLSPNVIRSHNHMLVEVTATIQVSEVCDPNPSIVLLSITSNEPDDGLGDGDTPNDIQEADFGTDDSAFLLRAERSGTGDGRIYTVTYQAVDASGNTITDTSQVTVPHDQSGP